MVYSSSAFVLLCGVALIFALLFYRQPLVVATSAMENFVSTVAVARAISMTLLNDVSKNRLIIKPKYQFDKLVSDKRRREVL